MSTYYYIVCDKHQVQCPACSSVGNGGPMVGKNEWLSKFIYDHRSCWWGGLGSGRGSALRVVDEHAPEHDEYERFKL